MPSTEGARCPVWLMICRDLANTRTSRKEKTKQGKSGPRLKSVFPLTRKLVPFTFTCVQEAWQMKSLNQLVANESYLGVVAKI